MTSFYNYFFIDFSSLQEEILIEVPAGVEDGQTIRLKVADSQEVLVLVKVEEKVSFRREGCHIHSDLLVDIWDAALGNVVEIQGLHGYVQVHLPKRLSSHTLLVLPGYGFKRTNQSKSFGNHYLHVKIKSIDIYQWLEDKNSEQSAEDASL